MTVQTVYDEHPKTCLIIGGTQAVVTGLSLPVCIAVGIYINLSGHTMRIALSEDGVKPFAPWEEVQTMSRVNVILYTVLFVNAVIFIMSLTLVAGVKEKNASWVKSYFNFALGLPGVIFVLIRVTVITYTCHFPWYGYLLYGIFMVFYFMVISLVRSTYKSFEASASYTDSSSKKITKEDKITMD